MMGGVWPAKHESSSTPKLVNPISLTFLSDNLQATEIDRETLIELLMTGLGLGLCYNQVSGNLESSNKGSQLDLLTCPSSQTMPEREKYQE